MMLRASVVALLSLFAACEVADAGPVPGDASRSDTSRDTSSAETTRADSVEETRADAVEETEEDADEETSTEAETVADVDEDEETAADVDEETAAEVDEETVADVDEETAVEVEDDATAPEVEDDTSVVEETIEDVAAETSEETTTPPEDTTAQCTSTITTFPTSAGHVANCSEVVYDTNPPTSGIHYGSLWAAFQNYTLPVARGFYVHSMEHGAVVFLYNCPDGCPDDVAALEAVIAARPKDPLCDIGINGRYILTPDPLLDTRFAVTAWGTHLKADCVDSAAMAAFADANYDHGTEHFCSQGVDVTHPLTDCDPNTNP